MPSLADTPSSSTSTRRAIRIRIALERAAHVLALALLVWLLVRSLERSRGASASATLEELPAALTSWSTVSAPARVHVKIDSALSPVARDWLSALAGTGTSITWEGQDVLPLAAVAEPIADPVGATGVWVAAPADSMVVLRDRVGVLDSVRAGAAGARFLVRSAPSIARAGAGALVTRSIVRDSLILKRLLVLGRVGWESKFVTAALEERGWDVDARQSLSPKGDVIQGGRERIDTARYAAVIVLDTTALSHAREIVSYVRAGGGLVIEAPPAAAAAMSPLRVGASGRVIPAALPFDSVATTPRRALALRPITLGGSAVAIQRRDSLVTVAALRVDRGRVVLVGYDDTWRWRMGGVGDALEQYREWWTDLVARVAYVGRTPRASSEPLDEAPYAQLVGSLGIPSQAAPGPIQGRTIPTAWLFSALAAALLLEWTSRRLRGAP